jgi:hypothetical protein
MEQHEGAIYLHSVLCEGMPDFYAQLLADPVAHISHKREIMVNLLGNPAARDVARQRILDMLYALPVSEALEVVAVIRERRINRSRARDLMLAFLIGHEQFPQMAATRKQRITHLLKHALGEQTWSAAKRFLANSTPEGESFLQRELLRYAWHGDTARAREVLCFLAGVPFKPTDPALAKRVAAREDLERGEGLPLATLLGLRGIYHKKVSVSKVRHLAAVPQVAQDGQPADGPLTALYKTVFEQIAATEVAQSTRTMAGSEHDLAELVTQAVAAIPVIEGRLAIVLDLSASMISSGERLYHPASLALALTRLLQDRVRDVTLHQVGGTAAGQDGLAMPQGTTDIASVLLTAAQQEPQVILVISDGYENVRQGDVEQVAQGLRRLGMTMPIYQVVPLFTAAERLSRRHLGAALPVIPLAHEDGVRELLAYTLLAAAGDIVSRQEIEQLQHMLLVR